MPFFSIIIPSYNRAKMIEDTVSSIQKQSFTDWECILVDDGSEDNTKDVVEKISKQDSRIKYVYQVNKERSAARNNGINHSTGQYICFLDSDDSFLEDHLQSLFDTITLKNNPIAFLFTNHIIHTEGTFSKELPPSIGKDVIEYLFYNSIIPARVCIHASILESEKFDEDIVIVEDLLLWVRIALKYPVIHVEKSTVIYNLHEDNSVNLKNNSATKRLKGLNVFLKKYPECVARVSRKIWKDIVGETHFSLMKYYLYKGDRFLGLKHLIVSIFYQKNNKIKHKIFLFWKILLNRSIPEYFYEPRMKLKENKN